MTLAPILRYFSPTQAIIIETNASNKVIASVTDLIRYLYSITANKALTLFMCLFRLVGLVVKAVTSTCVTA
jgi:uncharacterized membrane protein YfcA